MGTNDNIMIEKIEITQRFNFKRLNRHYECFTIDLVNKNAYYKISERGSGDKFVKETPICDDSWVEILVDLRRKMTSEIYRINDLQIDKFLHDFQELELFKDFPAPRLGYESITQKYSDAEGVRRELTLLKEQWPELKSKLQAQVWPYEKMKACFKTVGAPYEPEHIGVDAAWVSSVFPLVQLMRFRYNLLDIAKRGGFYDEIVL